MAENMLGKMAEDFHAAVAAAKHGDVLIYHVGTTADGPLCSAAYTLYERGLISLVQRRVSYVGVARFQYEAQRTKQKRRET